MTPGEFKEQVDGYNWRKEYKDKQVIEQAWMTAYFQRVKKLPSLSKLLKAKAANKKKRSKEELKQEWDALQEEFGL